MTNRKILEVAALAAVAFGLPGCYMPNPVAHATLHIAADGRYEINGQTVSADNLAATIGAAKPVGGSLVVQIEVAPAADVAAIRIAVAMVTSAHARVAFARDAQSQ
jgi:hypothetical protein